MTNTPLGEGETASLPDWEQKLADELVKSAMVVLGPAISRRWEGERGVCYLCGEQKEDICARRLNTAYAEDELNWQTSCLECFEKSVEMYEDMWQSIR